MSRLTITVVDTTGKQNYIFSSNRLRENIGASRLLSKSTKEWVEDSLHKLKIPKELQEKPIETSQVDAELIYADGGNALIIFRSHRLAIEFTEILSRRVLKEAPGINLLVIHDDFEWEKNDLYAVVEELKKNKIDNQKYERITSAPLLGLSVTASCNSTQLPAVDSSDKYISYGDDEEIDSYLISTETKQKLKAVPEANKHLQNIFANVFEENIYQFPYRTDHLGRSQGDSSYVAVVHADANGMGNRFKTHGMGKENRDYINAIRALSKSINQAGINALKGVAKVIIESIKECKIVGKIGEFELKSQCYLPFRPIVYAGDDITFICEGRLGLELAALFLREFEKQTATDNKPLTACAGICVVKTHYPFARAYQTSEDLCRAAKRFVKKNKGLDQEVFSAIDWHLATSGLIGSIADIRQREYQIIVDGQPQNLEMRPLRLHSHYNDWRTWDGITQVIKELKQGKEWKDRQNKVMALREILRKGSDIAVKEFLKSYNLARLPLFLDSCGQSEQLSRQGWLDGICGYFDAIEAMEFYISLGD